MIVPEAKMEVDSIDEKLVRLLGNDGLQTSEKLSEQIGLSSATVRRRVKRLIQNGLLRIVGVVNPSDFGYSVTTVICLNVAHGALQTIIEELSKFPQMRWVATTTGRYGIIATARFRSNREFSEFITKDLASIKEIKDVETYICLNLHKGSFLPFGMA
jgi:Lrp/AsnC family transcriptional regulator, regulator for asnA, asnC and gidA